MTQAIAGQLTRYASNSTWHAAVVSPFRNFSVYHELKHLLYMIFKSAHLFCSAASSMVPGQGETTPEHASEPSPANLAATLRGCVGAAVFRSANRRLCCDRNADTRVAAASHTTGGNLLIAPSWFAILLGTLASLPAFARRRRQQQACHSSSSSGPVAEDHTPLSLCRGSYMFRFHFVSNGGCRGLFKTENLYHYVTPTGPTI